MIRIEVDAVTMLYSKGQYTPYRMFGVVPVKEGAYENDKHDPVLSEKAKANSNVELVDTKFHSEHTVKLPPFKFGMFTLFFVV